MSSGRGAGRQELAIFGCIFQPHPNQLFSTLIVHFFYEYVEFQVVYIWRLLWPRRQRVIDAVRYGDLAGWRPHHHGFLHFFTDSPPAAWPGHLPRAVVCLNPTGPSGKSAQTNPTARSPRQSAHPQPWINALSPLALRRRPALSKVVAGNKYSCFQPPHLLFRAVLCTPSCFLHMHHPHLPSQQFLNSCLAWGLPSIDVYRLTQKLARCNNEQLAENVGKATITH